MSSARTDELADGSADGAGTHEAPAAADTDPGDIGGGRGGDGGGEGASLSTRLAFWSFVAYLGVAFVVILTVLGDERWFLGDEWTFLAGRDTGDVAGYFEPLNGHWVTLPLLWWRLTYEVVGLHSYLAYQVPVILMHLATAALLRVVMRRVGVSPWVATVAAGSFVLFGPGESNIVWGFQITLVGSVLAGLIHLLLADHDGPIDRRDAIGVAVGLVGLLCSGVSIMMVVGVGLAVLLRRGWRIAVFHTVPLGIIYLIWYAVYRPQTAVFSDEVGVGHYTDLGARFIWMGVSGVFTSLGDGRVVGLALALMFVVGLAFAWLPLDRRAFALRGALPVGLLLAGALLLLSSMLTRGFVFGAAEARADRYLHIFVALTLPALAVAGDAIARRWRYLTPVVLALFLIGIPGNIAHFEESPYNGNYFAQQRQIIFGVGRAEMAAEVPEWVAPEPSLTPDVTVGWLRDAIAEGKVPDPLPPTPQDANWPLRLGVAHVHEPVPDDLECKVRRRPIEVTPKVGRKFAVTDGWMTVTLLEDGEPIAPPISYDPGWAGQVISIEAPDLEVRFEPTPGTGQFTFCS